MKAAVASEPIEVGALRVGMFVHLDMGWMSHPFPLGSFRIVGEEQLETIRSLGVRQVRWSPSQSDPAAGSGLIAASGSTAPALASSVATTPAATPIAAPGTSTGTSTGTSAGTSAGPSTGAKTTELNGLPLPPERTATPAEPLLADPAVRAAQRRRLEAQRLALQRCELQFAEAARDCREVNELVLHQPAEARESAEKLSKALVDKMLGEQELCIRLLTTAAGDKAAQHALNVTIISLLMGRTFGLSEADMLDLGVGAMLHDVGKIELPERVRHRDDHLIGSELRLYEEHVAHGVGHARRMGLSAGATLVIAQHHEHADGSGFPLRLGSERLTAAARIVALVNRYDSLCNPHVAARAFTPHEALSLLFSQGRDKFDTAILGAFIRMMGVYPAGSTVQLTDNRCAMVVSVNSTRPLRPRVLVHDAGVPREDALILDLEGAHNLGIRRSLKPAQLPPASLEYLAPRPRVAYFFEPVTLGSAAEDPYRAAA